MDVAIGDRLDANLVGGIVAANVGNRTEEIPGAE